jgi:hypothetical protein
MIGVGKWRSARKSKSKDFDFTEFRCRRWAVLYGEEVNLEPKRAGRFGLTGIPVERFQEEYPRHEEGYFIG